MRKTASFTAPTGGWNARDPLDDMPEKDASLLQNWWPVPSGVQMRKGYTNYATGLPSQVNTLMAYNAGASSKLFAASGTSFYDVTSGGAVGAAVVSGLTTDKWGYANISTPGGNFLYAANGNDAPRLYNGTTWTAITGASTPAITGVTTTLLQHPYVAKSRMWFIEKNSLRVWYLPVNSVGGAASSLDFGAVFRRGGYLVSMASWTIDGGFGIKDLTVFVTSEGEMAIYEGYDPSSASNWSLSGLYITGAPMGERCFHKYGSDLLFINREGIMPMSQGRFFAELGEKGSITDKIQHAYSDATTAYNLNYGWQIALYPDAGMLIFNVPVALGQQEQYCMNTLTGAWAQFTGWAANCWELFRNDVYFGGNGVVSKAWYGQDDNGAQILCDCKQAFSYFGMRGSKKRFHLMRPMLQSNGNPAISASVNTDFDDTNPSALLTFTGTNAGAWDSAIWDSATWGAAVNVKSNWQGLNGIGYNAAIRLKCAAKGIDVTWLSTDIVFEAGGTL